MRQKFQSGFAQIMLILTVVSAVIVIGSFIFNKPFSKQIDPIELIAPYPKVQNFADTETWEKLINTRYNYELKYPQYLKATASGIEVNETNASQVIIYPNLEDLSINSKAIYVNAEEKNQTVFANHSLQEIAQTNYDANKSNSSTVSRMLTDLKSTTFALEPAFTYEMESSGFAGRYLTFTALEGRNKVIEVEKNGIYYIIFSSVDPTLDQTLSTFKFTE